MKQKPKVIVVVGPTASGKTSLAVKIAKEFEGEVISADSRQVYKGLDIGTGKVTEAEMDGVAHHLLDVADPMETYTVVDYERDSTSAVTDILSRNLLPIFAGGTFFYTDLLRGKQQSAPVPPNETFRDSLREFSNATLLEKLYATDPERASKIDPNNRRRLVRSLEIVNELGKVPEPSKAESPYDWLVIGVEASKEYLLEKFAMRLEHWLEIGFQNEVEDLIEAGVTRKRMQELGFEYTLILELIDGKLSLDELKEKFVQKNWQYAKRQKTWLKRDNEIEWFTPENGSAIFRRIKSFLSE